MKDCSKLSGKLPCSFVYLLLSHSKTAYVYVGMTSRPLKFRLAEHNSGKGRGYTARRGPWSLLACRAYLSTDCAYHAEQQLKRSKYDKRNWIKHLAKPASDQRSQGRLRKLCERHSIQHPLA